MLNKEIEARIERNKGKIMDQKTKIAIYPYGKLGRQTREVLENTFHIGPTYIVDNNGKQSGIISFADFLSFYDDDTIILFSTEKRTIFLKLFEEMLLAGINTKSIVIIQLNQLLAYEALENIINDLEHVTVLDIGCGQGLHGRIMQDYGKKVTGVTVSKEDGYNGKCLENVIYADFLKAEFKEVYDIVWVSHVLEHIMDVENFLRKMRKVIARNGCVAITVPKETSILLPHIHTFSAGRLLRYLLCAGYDCRNAEILEYGYNISVILPEVKFIEETFDIKGFVNESANGTEADKIFEYLPPKIELKKSWDNIYYFNGDIQELNWNESNHSIYL